jgi:hypothetical protein
VTTGVRSGFGYCIGSWSFYCHTTKIEQMFERLLAKMDANQTEMKTNQEMIQEVKEDMKVKGKAVPVTGCEGS